MFNRIFNPSKSNSYFIFGARGTGKTTWLMDYFADIPHLYIDLLNPDEEERLAKNPAALLAQVKAMGIQTQWIIIDEVQKIPKLLDVVQLCIEKYKKLFVLTGSSARKLKRGAANLLAGRAFVHNLFPLTSVELGDTFDLRQALRWGTLPKLFSLSDTVDKIRYLKTYAQTYLKEEIIAEQIVRKLDPFRFFLEIAAQQNGDIINFSNIGRDVAVDTLTVQSYFQILDDTLIGFLLHPFHESVRKRQRTNPKFYFFDCGVKRALDGTLEIDINESTYGFGRCFEHFVIAEIFRLNSYYEKSFRFSYLRTKDDAEIDLIAERPGLPLALIEIKSSQITDERDIKTLRSFQKDMKQKTEGFLFSRDPIPKIIEGIRLLPWQEGIKEMGLVS